MINQDNDPEDNSAIDINENYFNNASAKRQRLVLSLLDEYKRIKEVQDLISPLELRVLYKTILEHEKKCFGLEQVTMLGEKGMPPSYDAIFQDAFLSTIQEYCDYAFDYVNTVAIFKNFYYGLEDNGRLEFPEDITQKTLNPLVSTGQILIELSARGLLDAADFGERLAHWQMYRIAQAYYARSSADMAQTPYPTQSADFVASGKTFPEVRIFSQRQRFAESIAKRGPPIFDGQPSHDIAQIIHYIDHIIENSSNYDDADRRWIFNTWRDKARTLYGSTLNDAKILIAPGVETTEKSNQIPSLSPRNSARGCLFAGHYLSRYHIDILPALKLNVPDDAYSHHCINFVWSGLTSEWREAAQDTTTAERNNQKTKDIQTTEKPVSKKVRRQQERIQKIKDMLAAAEAKLTEAKKLEKEAKAAKRKEIRQNKLAARAALRKQQAAIREQRALKRKEEEALRKSNKQAEREARLAKNKQRNTQNINADVSKSDTTKESTKRRKPTPEEKHALDLSKREAAETKKKQDEDREKRRQARISLKEQERKAREETAKRQRLEATRAIKNAQRPPEPANDNATLKPEP